MDLTMIVIVLMVLALAFLAVMTVFLFFMARQLFHLSAVAEETRQYLAGVYGQIAETNEMVASAENNSFIIASKAIEKND